MRDVETWQREVDALGPRRRKARAIAAEPAKRVARVRGPSEEQREWMAREFRAGVGFEALAERTGWPLGVVEDAVRRCMGGVDGHAPDVAPVAPCAGCGHGAAVHAVDDEERRECLALGCACGQYGRGGDG